MIQSRSEITVRYAETDKMGFVYHANFLPWFEIGRTQLLKEHGFPYRQLEDEGFLLPVLEVSVRYLRPAYYDDSVTVVTILREKPSVRIHLEYELYRQETLLATGRTLHAFVSPAGQPLKPPPAFSRRMAELFPAG